MIFDEMVEAVASVCETEETVDLGVTQYVFNLSKRQYQKLVDDERVDEEWLKEFRGISFFKGIEIRQGSGPLLQKREDWGTTPEILDATMPVEERTEICVSCANCHVAEEYPLHDPSGPLPPRVHVLYCRLRPIERKVEATYWCAQHSARKDFERRIYLAGCALTGMNISEVFGRSDEDEEAINVLDMADIIIEKASMTTPDREEPAE